MKFYCDGTNLSNAANTVSKALAVNKNIPILEGIKLEASENKLTLSAYNQEIYIEKTIPAEIYEPGELVVNGKILADYANKISNKEKIEISQSLNNKLNIKIGKSYSELNYYEVQNFPDLGEYNDDVSVTMKQSDLKELLDRAIFCVSMNDNRLLLKSCNLEMKGESLEAVCLDGFRVGIGRKVPVSKKGDFKCIILGKIISDIIKILDDSDDEVVISKYNNMVIFDLGATKIRTTTVEGEFYKYENSLPKNIKTEVIIDKNQLEECLIRASIISREKYYNAVTIDIDENIMNIVADSEKGRVDENIDCKTTGEPMKITLNNKYLLEAVNRIKEDFMKIEFEGSVRPILVTKTDGDEFRSIILPVRIV